MIDLTKNEAKIQQNVKHCRERKIKLPTFGQMQNPETIPEEIKDELKNVGLWETHPANLFRISWKNEPVSEGGGFGGVNYIVIPPELSGVKAKIIALVGKWFPTGAHKVGATYGCLAPALTTGQFCPGETKAVWPSTGNYCRGGAYVSSLLGCDSIAILPENMSRERFAWLEKVAGEVIATPGCESNVKEIFDKCWELKKTRNDIQIFNQFEEFGNPLWHYMVTGKAAEEALLHEMRPKNRFAGAISSSGSAGSMAFGYYLKDKFPGSKLAVAEALQCPTLLYNGFGDHRIEGIGDKHVPWIHDCKNTDMVIGVDDEVTIRLLRLFNETLGRDCLVNYGVDNEFVNQLDRMGISCIGNVIAAIKFSKYYELTENDYVVTILTDSMELYGSRVEELAAERGQYTNIDAHKDMQLLMDSGIDNVLELTHYEKKRIHNLKYFTWIEQQGRELDELNSQWYDHDSYWNSIFSLASKIDELIEEFNGK
ncbi:pyridoxal-phosphate dependent enzyme [Deltaproteobacteria bacterium]|nr:pyridoxal-phosphate dependent enzyme [Deltaproteobacteria bacterium]